MLALSDKYGKERFIKVCHICSECHEYSYQQMLWMLRNGEDYDLEPEEEEEDRPLDHTKKHGNIRGKDYFGAHPDDTNTKTTNNNEEQD